jgi:hypothetical protein
MVASDFVLAILPITFIRVIKRPLREKVVLAVLMGFGIIAGVAGVIKVSLLHDVMAGTDPFFDETNVGIAQ